MIGASSLAIMESKLSRMIEWVVVDHKRIEEEVSSDVNADEFATTAQ